VRISVGGHGSSLAVCALVRIALVAALAACSSSSRTPDAAAPLVYTQRFSNEMDVLFVIDNSASTSDKQALFAANFPRLAQALDAFPGGRPDLHVGIVDTTVDIGVQGFGPGCPSPDENDNGLLQNTPRVTGCTPPSGRFITNADDLVSTFSCIAQVGAVGCGFEAPLEAMKRALDRSRPENAGFLRDDANLAIVFLTDEDDCSVRDPSLFMMPTLAAGPGDFRCQPLVAYDCDQPITLDPATYTGCKPHVSAGAYLQDPVFYAEFLHAIRPEQRIAVAAIIGDPTPTISTGPITTPFDQTLALLPSCSATIDGNPTIARPGIRLQSFVDQFGTAGRTYSICQSDYSAALTDIGGLMKDMMRPCVADAIDTTDVDPDNPGLQLSCEVVTGVFNEVGTILPACHMLDATTPAQNEPPCWWFELDPTCGTPTNAVLHIHGASQGLVGISCARAK